MFKIKKSSKRNIASKEILTDNNPNLAPAQPQTAWTRRPLTAKIARKSNLHPQPEDLQSHSSCQQSQGNIAADCQTIDMRIADRASLEEEIRRTFGLYFKDKCCFYGQIKEALVQRVLEKAVLKITAQGESSKDELITLLQHQMDKMQRSKQCTQRYEQTITKIQNMLQERLKKLSCLR